MTAERDSEREQDEPTPDEQPKLEKETLRDLDADGERSEKVRGGEPWTFDQTCDS